jgi:sulfate adenylyltransferase subunit 1
MLGRPVQSAAAPQSVSLVLADELDIARGDLITPAENPPALRDAVTATVCNLVDPPLRAGDRVLLKHATRTVRAVVKAVTARLRPDDLVYEPADGRLDVNDIGTVELRTAESLPVDAFSLHPVTGSFILVDPQDGATRVAGMVAAEAMAGYPTEVVDSPSSTV